MSVCAWPTEQDHVGLPCWFRMKGPVHREKLPKGYSRTVLIKWRDLGFQFHRESEAFFKHRDSINQVCYLQPPWVLLWDRWQEVEKACLFFPCIAPAGTHVLHVVKQRGLGQGRYLGLCFNSELLSQRLSISLQCGIKELTKQILTLTDYRIQPFHESYTLKTTTQKRGPYSDKTLNIISRMSHDKAFLIKGFHRIRSL